MRPSSIHHTTSTSDPDRIDRTDRTDGGTDASGAGSGANAEIRGAALAGPGTGTGPRTAAAPGPARASGSASRGSASHGSTSQGSNIALRRRRWTVRFQVDDMAYLDAERHDGIFALPAAEPEGGLHHAATLPARFIIHAQQDITGPSWEGRYLSPPAPSRPASLETSLIPFPASGMSPPWGRSPASARAAEPAPATVRLPVARAQPMRSSRFASALPASVPTAAAASRWQFPETESGAAAFNLFQSRLSQTASHQDVALRAGFEQRVDTLVGAMREAPALRDVCFRIAEDAVATCGDRIALGLNEMELARIDHGAGQGRLGVRDLLALGENLFKAHMVQQIAGRKIAALTCAGKHVDDTEVRLLYQVALAERLALPVPADAMLYRRLANVSDAELAEAEQEIRQALGRSACVDYLAQWMPWRRAMERAWPEAYEAVRAFNQAPRDALVIQPRRMSEQEWREAFVTQAADEETQLSRLTARLTRQFLEENDID